MRCRWRFFSIRTIGTLASSGRLNLAAAGVLTVLPGALVVWFVRKDLVKGFALGRVS